MRGKPVKHVKIDCYLFSVKGQVGITGLCETCFLAIYCTLLKGSSYKNMEEKMNTVLPETLFSIDNACYVPFRFFLALCCNIAFLQAVLSFKIS